MANIPIPVRMRTCILFFECIVVAIIQAILFGRISFKHVIFIKNVKKMDVRFFLFSQCIIFDMILVVSQIFFIILINRFHQIAKSLLAEMEVILSTTKKEYSHHQLKDMYRNFLNKIMTSNLKLTVSLFLHTFAIAWVGRDVVFPISAEEFHYYPLRVPWLILILLYPTTHSLFFTNQILSESTSTVKTLGLESRSTINNDTHCNIFEKRFESQNLQKFLQKCVVCNIAVAIACQFWITFTIMYWRPALYCVISFSIMNVVTAIAVFLCIIGLMIYIFDGCGNGKHQMRYHDDVLII